MSKKIYAGVLYLLAPHFYRVYGKEAIRLVRDRCRDEQGVASKIHLWLDLLTDLVVAAIRDGRFRRQVLLSQLASAHALKPLPSFTIVSSGLPGTTALLVGGALSLGILAMLPALIGHGGHSRAVSPPLIGVLQASEMTRGTSKGSHISEQNRLLQTHPFGTPAVSAPLGDGSLTLADAAIDANEKRRVLESAIANLREYYVYPNLARQMISALRTHEKNGDYENEIGGADFAALLTKQLQDVSHDRHLRVVYSAAEMPDRPLGPPEADSNFQSKIKRDNCAFRKVEVLPHNIGYLKFNAFLPRAYAAARPLPPCNSWRI